jgi:hypothetical protein
MRPLFDFIYTDLTLPDVTLSNLIQLILRVIILRELLVELLTAAAAAAACVTQSVHQRYSKLIRLPFCSPDNIPRNRSINNFVK